MRRLTLVTGTEWQGLYRDGLLVAENHSLSAADVLNAIDGHEALWAIIVDRYHAKEVWLGNRSGLPERLQDVVCI